MFDAGLLRLPRTRGDGRHRWKQTPKLFPRQLLQRQYAVRIQDGPKFGSTAHC